MIVVCKIRVGLKFDIKEYLRSHHFIFMHHQIHTFLGTFNVQKSMNRYLHKSFEATYVRSSIRCDIELISQQIRAEGERPIESPNE